MTKISLNYLRLQLARTAKKDVMEINMRAKLNQQLIQEKIVKAMVALTEATKIADDTGVSFNFSVAYGIGGSYNPEPKPMTVERAKVLVATGLDTREVYKAKSLLGISTPEEDEAWEESSSNDYGWVSSSVKC